MISILRDGRMTGFLRTRSLSWLMFFMPWIFPDGWKAQGVSAFSVHPGWIRSNLAQHFMPVWVQNVVMRPFSGLLGMMSWYEGAQTTLHCPAR